MRITWFVAIAVLLFCFFSDGNNIAYSQARFMDTKIEYETPNPNKSEEFKKLDTV